MIHSPSTLLALLISLLTVTALAACDLTGACVGTGGIVDECKEGWTQQECTDWDEQEVNGASWSLHLGGSCEAVGFPFECADGGFVKQAGDC
jgi:hypothetical protein